MNLTPTDTSDTRLEQLVKRSDIWRGNSRALVRQLTLDTGYTGLNASLLNVDGQHVAWMRFTRKDYNNRNDCRLLRY